MSRATGGLIATDIQQEVTSLARLLKIQRQGDGVIAKVTDHDEDIFLSSEDTRASAEFNLCLTDIDGPTGTGHEHGPKPGVGFLSATGVPLHTNTMTIGSRIYTFITGAFTATGQILIGAGVPATFANAVQAIIAGSGAGTVYSTGTTAHPDVTAHVCDITLPNPLENQLLATGKITAYFSNFVTNSGNWHNGERQMNSPNQPKTTNQKEGVWCGVTLNTPTSIVFAKVYSAQLWHTHTTSGATYVYEYDHVTGPWYGAYSRWDHRQGEFQMTIDGFTWATG